jgi:hypothetical protein
MFIGICYSQLEVDSTLWSQEGLARWSYFIGTGDDLGIVCC